MDCARTIVELITHYWPYSIDILEPERAIIDGFRPVFYPSHENVCSLLLGQSGTKSYQQGDFERSFFGKGQGETVEFGAGQCMAPHQRYFIPYQSFLLRYTRPQ